MGGPEIVTLLFTDLVGSTKLLDRLGEEAAEEVRRAYFTVLREALGASGGNEVKNLGDGLMAVFPSAVDALSCAVAIQQAVATQNRRRTSPPLSVRVGLHLGEPIQDENDYFGTPVVIAKRLCDAAHGDQILASQLVADLVGTRRRFRMRSVGRLPLKGLADPIPAVEVDPQTTAAVSPRSSDKPAFRASDATTGPESVELVGREREVAVLDAEVARSLAGQFRCLLLTGAIGAGKTFLSEALLNRYRHDVVVLTARAHTFDEASPFGLWLRAVDRHLRNLDGVEVMELCGVFLEDLTGVLRSVGALNGSIVDPGAAPKPVLDGLTAVVTGLATRAPVFMFFDDVHRADDSFWEALEHFAHQLADDPIVVLAAARDRDLADQPSATEVIHRLEEDGLLRRIAVDPIDEMNTPGREGAAVSEGVPDSLEDPAAALVIARGALARGDLDGVVTALAELEQPEAHELLARVRYATEDVIDCRHHWESAFRGYRDTGDLRAAARCAINLGRLNYNAFGHEAVSRGWLARAARLIDHVGRCVERGYLELALVACDVWDVSALEASAALALELAIEFGDSALEARALADSGLALVSQGRITEGFARLDEAMIPITAGELNDRVTAGAIFCAMLSACERAGDIRRAEEWAGVCAELMLDPAGGRPPVLHAHCRIVYGSVLCTAGKWAEAETEILRAIGPSGTRYVTKRAEAIGRLAELRVRQGRLEEAAGLLEAVEDRYEVAEPLARLHFARGELDLAGAVIDRTLRQLVGDRLRSGPLLVLLVELELARGDLEAAGRAASRLAECSDGAESVLLRAQAARSAGLLAAKRGEWDLALKWFQVAQAAFPNDEQPFLSATLRLDAAEVLAAAGDTAAAVSETRAALALFERVGACSDADRASAFLRSLGAPARRRSGERAAMIGQLSSREQQVLRLLGEGLTNADIGQRLYITSKTAEHHVSRILTKLGVRTRAEAAAMAAALVVAPA